MLRIGLSDGDVPYWTCCSLDSYLSEKGTGNKNIEMMTMLLNNIVCVLMQSSRDGRIILRDLYFFLTFLKLIVRNSNLAFLPASIYAR